MGLDQPSRLVECKRRAAPTGRSGLKPGRLGFPVVVLRTSDRHRPQSWAGPAMSYSSPPQSPDGVGHDRWRPRTAMPFSSFRIGIAAGEPPAGACGGTTQPLGWNGWDELDLIRCHSLPFPIPAFLLGLVARDQSLEPVRLESDAVASLPIFALPVGSSLTRVAQTQIGAGANVGAIEDVQGLVPATIATIDVIDKAPVRRTVATVF